MSAPPRYAKQRDKSEALIVEALRKVLGASVHLVESEKRSGVPDLLVGWGGQDGLLEVKNPEEERGRKDVKNGKGRRPPTEIDEAQARWHRSWRGRPVVTVRTPEEAVAWVRSWKLPTLSTVLRAEHEAGGGSWQAAEDSEAFAAERVRTEPP